ncbi:hypothetical protein SJI00_08335 [Pseudomonas sp. RP23018S]|uniref:DUF6630 family protein n=1 Tax=Pseudomonas sp. RP23018S TaxID=3096037 RepID=UPI002ACAF2DE|nr:hypothetical protein [Pseudomonas sp. RP23018S]MDZ5602779.1 hypothetical protein [Pseudomonas sp. RP23018S]
MGLFDRLFGGRFSLPPPDEPAISEAEAFRALHPCKRELKAFAQALLQRLPAAERERLVRRVMRAYTLGDEPTAALLDGLLDPDKGQRPEHLTLLAVDVRGFDQFEYLAPLLVATRAIGAGYRYTPAHALAMTQVLAEFDQWLTGHGQRWLYLSSDADQYVGLIAEPAQVEPLIALAAQAQIRLSLQPD